MRFGGVMHALVLALGLALWGTAVDAATSRSVTFRTDDGVTIAGTFYESAKHPAPAVILVHALTRSKDDWQTLAGHLADAGLHALAIDLRGHGQSASAPPGPDGEPDLTKMVLDIQAARAWLGTHGDVVKASSIAIVGASIGANLAMVEAGNDPAIKGLVLLSAGQDYRAVRPEGAFRRFSPRPALFVAGSNDAYAVRSMKFFAAIGPGVRETRTIEGGGHGPSLLAKDPSLAQALVDWLLRSLV